jgi:alkenylglycerophosphocholine/alkenylglycerophosphoethanolamine hydrolase
MPFLFVGVVHLVTLVTINGPASSVTKLLLMPALLLAVLWALRLTRSDLLVFACLGVILSWAGDALLASPGDIGFLLGLGAFMLAHLAYLVLFLRPLRERRIPWLAATYALWWVVLVLYLAPHIGALLLPVAAYGFVLAASSAAALGTSRFSAVGALLFLLSDTILAFKLFVPGADFYPVDAIIMTLYITGQGLIAYGVATRGYRFRSQPQQ